MKLDRDSIGKAVKFNTLCETQTGIIKEVGIDGAAIILLQCPVNNVWCLKLHTDLIVGFADEYPFSKDVLLSREFRKWFHSNVDSSLSIGLDPEFFVVDNDSEEIIPAFDFLPLKYRRLDHFGPFCDGFQAEFNTCPTTCLEIAALRIEAGLSYIHNFAAKVHGKITPKSVVPVDVIGVKEEYLELGCNKSMNAYDNWQGPVVDGRELRWRCAGAHVHFGLEMFESVEYAKELVKVLDQSMGVASVALVGHLEDPLRRTLYGRAGEFRMPPHGLEYRVLSNMALIHPCVFYLLLEMGRYLMKAKMVRMEKEFGWKDSVGDEEVVNCINTLDVKKAHQILKVNRLFWSRFFSEQFGIEVKKILWRMLTHKPPKFGDNLIENWHKVEIEKLACLVGHESKTQFA